MRWNSHTAVAMYLCAVREIISVVSNNLVSDQRVHKWCETLHAANYGVTLVGCLRPKESVPAMNRPYKHRHVRVCFRRGAWFYAHLNCVLFFYLLLRSGRARLFLANDLDTLPAVWLAARLSGRRVIFDSHEIFPEVPEIAGKPLVKGLWAWLEARLLPRSNAVFTVNRFIAQYFQEKHGRHVHVVCNYPRIAAHPGQEVADRSPWAIPNGVPLLLLQGAGINIDRGGEELVEAMHLLPDVHLCIVGKGDALPVLKERAKRLSNVHFLGLLPYAQMMELAQSATLGVSLDKDTNLNYRFSLPNKLFDYLRAGLPVVVSDLPAVREIVTTYRCGSVLREVTPECIAQTVRELIHNPKQLETLRENAKFAHAKLNWEVQEPLILAVVDGLFRTGNSRSSL